MSGGEIALRGLAKALLIAGGLMIALVFVASFAKSLVDRLRNSKRERR